MSTKQNLYKKGKVDRIIIDKRAKVKRKNRIDTMMIIKTIMRLIDEDDKHKRKMNRKIRKSGSKWRSLLRWNMNNKKSTNADDNGVPQPTRTRVHNEAKVGLLSRLPQLDSMKNVRTTRNRSDSFNILAVLGNDDSHSNIAYHLQDDDIDYVVTNHSVTMNNLTNNTDHCVRIQNYTNADNDESDTTYTSDDSLPVDQKIYEWTKHRQYDDNKDNLISQILSTRAILKSKSSPDTIYDKKQINSVRFENDLSFLLSPDQRSPPKGLKVHNGTDVMTSPNLYTFNGIASLKETLEFNSTIDRQVLRRESSGMPSLIASSTSSPTTRGVSSSSNPMILKPKSIQKRQVSIQEQRLRSFSKCTFFRTICDDVFDVVDCDQVGAIDEKEFFNGLLLIQLNLGAYLGSSACIKPISRTKAIRLFHNIDHDHAGVIDKIDFREVMVVLLRNVFKQLIFHWITIILFVPFLTCFVIDTLHHPVSCIIQTFTIICNFFLGTETTGSSIPTILSSSNHQPSLSHFVGLLMQSVGIVFRFILDMTPYTVKQSLPIIITSIVLGMFVVPYIHSQINALFSPNKSNQNKFRTKQLP